MGTIELPWRQSVQASYKQVTGKECESNLTGTHPRSRILQGAVQQIFCCAYSSLTFF
jgi:hypothetical protein